MQRIGALRVGHGQVDPRTELPFELVHGVIIMC